MKREIAIHEVTDIVLDSELKYLADYFRGLGYEQCRLLFGWHWGMEFYSTNEWYYLDIALVALQPKVLEVQASGVGCIGGDDLLISVPPVDCEFCFCHHNGIHLSFESSSEVTAHFFERWRSAKLSPIERECIADRKSE
jgi:hypothetical protein